MNAEEAGTTAYMWGYLPGISAEKSPIVTPMSLALNGEKWRDVCGGGCGFAMAISGSGKLMTWGSTDDEGHSYVTSGKHGETPEAFPLPSEAPVINAVAGWAHCVSVTEVGEVYTWGWKECVPSGKFIPASIQKDAGGKQNSSQNEPASPKAQNPNLSNGAVAQSEKRKDGEELVKRRRVSVPKEDLESSSSGDDFFTTSPSVVTLGPGVKIATVTAGGRHTLALSDVGQVWGWGYGGEGQLGLGTRIKMVSTPHLIPCIDQSGATKDKALGVTHQAGTNSSTEAPKIPGSYVKKIACGGRHSLVITDTGVLLAFGWGLYGQCGQGNTNDQLRPTCVSSLSGVKVEGVAAGLWHTVCITADGDVYAFGGNQFGQLGSGATQAETQPRLLDAPSLQGKRAKIVSCGARHSAILTDDGQIHSWGWNKYGQLGVGDTIDRNIPAQVQIPNCKPRNVACGWWHTLLLAEAETSEGVGLDKQERAILLG